MISPKKLIKIATKWQTVPFIYKKKVSNFVKDDYDQKGHFVVYTTDERRFVMPLKYLNHNILQQLLKMSEEEFGLLSEGPLMLPCDAEFLEYVIALIKRGLLEQGLEKALLKSIDPMHCSSSLSLCSSLSQGEIDSQQFLVCGC